MEEQEGTKGGNQGFPGCCREEQGCNKCPQEMGLLLSGHFGGLVALGLNNQELEIS